MFENSKSSLRVEMKRVLNALTDEEIKHKSIRIESSLLRLSEFNAARSFSAFMPIKHEVDLSDFVFSSRFPKKDLYLPKVIGDTNEMILYRCSDAKKDLQKGAFGILEPRNTLKKATFDLNLDCMLIPGLSFGIDGSRLGRGRGFYDRFLNKHNNVFRVGLCFESQLLQSVPSEKHDVSMHVIVTEKRIIRIGT